MGTIMSMAFSDVKEKVEIIRKISANLNQKMFFKIVKVFKSIY